MKSDKVPVEKISHEQDGDEGFLSRWSRRKSLAREGQEDELEVAGDASALSGDPADELAPVEEVYHPTDEDMPPVESLDENSDYSGFMSPRVSDELRRLALRKLFHTPVFNIRDGLDDYDEDYTSFEPLGDTITSDMKFHAEMEALKKQEAERLGAVEENAELETSAQQENPATENEVQIDEASPEFSVDESPVEQLDVEADGVVVEHLLQKSTLESGNETIREAVVDASADEPRPTPDSPGEKHTSTT